MFQLFMQNSFKTRSQNLFNMHFFDSKQNFDVKIVRINVLGTATAGSSSGRHD
jgi:hypothetical protein